MSVNFNVRRLSTSIVSAVRADPTLTTFLCDFTLDFDPSQYEQDALRGRASDQIEAIRASLVTRRDRQLAAQEELFASLEGGGIPRQEVDLGLHLEKSWWGMAEMIGSLPGTRIVVETEGEAIGDDVGYGPARLLSPGELPPIVLALEMLTREPSERRFRARLEEDAAEKKSRNLGVLPPLTDEEFEKWTWQPLCSLRAYVRETADAGAWLLKWYD